MVANITEKRGAIKMKNLSDLYYRLSVEKMDQEFPETEAEREAGAQFAKLL